MRAIVQILVCASLIFPSVSGAWAQDAQDAPATPRDRVVVAALLGAPVKPPSQSRATPVDEFMSCVSSSRECELIAHSQGYHHHWVRYAHHLCQYEPHLACWAQ